MPKPGSKSTPSTLSERLQAKGARPTKRSKEPLWKGPHADGVTQSLLQSFLCCRERFRVKTVDGLGPEQTFRHAMEYGNMWHVCEEALAANLAAKVEWKTPLKEYAKKLATKYPLQVEQIFHWMRVCETQFPHYVSWWKKHPDVMKRTPVFQEYAFKIPYTLPSSGRVVFLRGKFDSVDLIGDKTSLYLQENKTKGDIEPLLLQAMLRSGFDLQTMFYLNALREGMKSDSFVQEKIRKASGAMNLSKVSVKGVRYNVIRRPLSGGKGSIRKHQPTKAKPQGESDDEFYSRLSAIFNEGVEPDGSHYFFMRWRSEVSEEDVDRFNRLTLNPLLEQLCDWWDWIEAGQPPGKIEMAAGSLHFRYPYGVYNPIAEGSLGDVDNYLNTGSEVGLVNITTLFPELEE